MSPSRDHWRLATHDGIELVVLGYGATIREVVVPDGENVALGFDTVAEYKAHPDDYLGASDLVIPPTDLTVDEARELFTEEGLIPDLPVASG